MHRHLVTLVACVATLLCASRSTTAMTANAAHDTLTIIVIDRSTMDPPIDRLYIASSANAWDPQGTPAVERTPATDDTPQSFRFEIPYRIASHPTFRFKFTRGSWETVETQSDGNYLQNRDLEDELVGRPATVTFEVHNFADAIDTIPSTVVGTLETFELESEHMENTRTIRVWLPEGYKGATDTYPVLYMHDGQNCFDRNTAAFGMEWGIDDTLTSLIKAGDVPPMIVVGIDNAGPMRSWEYNAPEINFQGRLGRADRYVRFLTEELMPAIEARFRVKSGPEHTAIGGSSFGGNITVYTLMHTQGVFGAALIESPAIRYAGPQFEDLILEHKGPWCERVFIGMGTNETGDPARDPIYAEAATVLADHMTATGVDPDRLTLVIEDGAAHNELAWAKRFPDAARALFSQ
ncbi:MAG: alpha/beta hydrolase-fold protein [Phycisphaerales bacterium]